MNLLPRGHACAAIFLLAPVPCWSMTAQEAWDAWKAAAGESGQTVTAATETPSGPDLRLSGVTISQPMDALSITAEIEQVVLAGETDGSVRITLSERIPIEIAGTGSEGEKIDATVDLTHSALRITAAEEGGQTSFEVMAASGGMRLSSLLIDDRPFPLDLSGGLASPAGSYLFGDGDIETVEVEFAAEGLELAADMRDPEGSGEVSLELTIADLVSSSQARSPDVEGSDDLAEMLRAGFATAGKAGFGATTYSIAFREDDAVFDAAGSLTGGTAEVGLEPDRMLYDMRYDGLRIAAQGTDLPVPAAEISLAEAAIRLDLPVLPADSATPFGIRLALREADIGQALWDLLDPSGALEHGPATLVVAVSGIGRWLVDIFDERTMANMAAMGTRPGEVEEIRIDDLGASVAGAALTGTGGFRIDNSDTGTFGGLPRPEGAVELRLAGGNALLDGLVDTGILPAEHLMAARMMLGMLATPAPDGGDVVTSRIEIDTGGRLLINGAPMPF